MSHKRVTNLFALVIVAGTTALAQIPAPPKSQTVALTHFTIYPVTNDPVPDGSIVFIEGKITDIGTNVVIPKGCVTINLKGKHVYPVLIQTYSNLGLTEIGAVGVTNDSTEHGDINPNVRAEVAINPESEHIPVARVNGIGLAVAAPSGGLIAGQTALIQTDGWTWKEMTFKAPLSLMIHWPRMTGFARDEKKAKEQKKNMREQLKRLDKAVEDAKAYMRAHESGDTTQRQQIKTDVRWEAMIPVLRREMPVWIRANSLLEIEAAVAWSHKHNLKMVLVGGNDAGCCADLLKNHNVPVILTGVLRLPSRRDADFDEPFVLPLKLHEAGIKFCIASGGASNIRNLPYHAAKAAAYGLPKNEALKAITLYPAQIMGVSDNVGSLGPGKDATLIVTDGDPLEITTNVERLYIQGRLIDLTNKQQRLYDKYKLRYEQIKQEGKITQ